MITQSYLEMNSTQSIIAYRSRQSGDFLLKSEILPLSFLTTRVLLLMHQLQNIVDIVNNLLH